MTCPKCQFDAVADGAGSCPRCGVVFAKLSRERPARPVPRRAPPPPAPSGGASGERVSLVNIALLSVTLCAAGAIVYQHYGPEPVPPAEAVPSTAPGARPPREVVVEVPSPEPGGALLVLPRPGAGPSEALPDLMPEPVPDLPELGREPVTPGLIDFAITVAREHPDHPELRAYVATAYLLLAGQRLKDGDRRDALRQIDAAEPWGADRGQSAALRALVYEQEESWETAEKWATTALSEGARANAAAMHHILGKVHYFREELDAAVEEFRTAIALRDDPQFRMSLSRALRDAESSRGFDRERLSHFIVRYEGETMEGTGRMVLDQMERSYASLVSELGFQPSEPVVVILYSRRSYREMGGPHWSAGLFDGKIRIPVQGLEHLDEHVRSTLHHELAHAFVHARAGRSAPRWLHEGLAEHMEGARAEAGGALLAQALQRQSLEGCLASAQCDVRVFYPAATSLVDYMIQVRGMGGVRDLLTALGEGDDIDAALVRVMGRDQAGLIRDWEHFVKRRY